MKASESQLSLASRLCSTVFHGAPPGFARCFQRSNPYEVRVWAQARRVTYMWTP
jgi:hypothetical protein